MNTPPNYIVALVGGDYKVLKFCKGYGYYDPIATCKTAANAKDIADALNREATA